MTLLLLLLLLFLLFLLSLGRRAERIADFPASITFPYTIAHTLSRNEKPSSFFLRYEKWALGGAKSRVRAGAENSFRARKGRKKFSAPSQTRTFRKKGKGKEKKFFFPLDNYEIYRRETFSFFLSLSSLLRFLPSFLPPLRFLNRPAFSVFFSFTFFSSFSGKRSEMGEKANTPPPPPPSYDRGKRRRRASFSFSYGRGEDSYERIMVRRRRGGGGGGEGRGGGGGGGASGETAKRLLSLSLTNPL